jgi:putative acetyltransferase
MFFPPFAVAGFARSLVLSASAATRSISYRALFLDTLSSMRSAIALYESIGFQRTAPYHPNPLPDVLYFRMSLEPSRNL